VCAGEQEEERRAIKDGTLNIVMKTGFSIGYLQLISDLLALRRVTPATRCA